LVSSLFPLTVLIQDELIEVPATGLLAHIRVHHLGSQLLQGNGIGEGLAATLEGEGHLHIADGEALAINGADTQTPGVGIIARQLRNIVGQLAQSVRLAAVVDVLDVLDETRKVGDHKLLPEGLGDQDDIGSHHSEKGRDVMM